MRHALRSRLPDDVTMQTWGIVGGALVGTVALGAVVAFFPIYSALAVATLAGLSMLLLDTKRLHTVFFWLLGLLLVAYAFLGRGIAHLGGGPIYLGELVLGFALVTMVVSWRSIRLGALETLVTAFIVWGVARTVPFVVVHGTDTLRDAVIWSYAPIGLAVTFIARRDHFDTVCKWYGKIHPAFIMWVPIVLGMWIAFGSSIPAAPGAEVSIVYPKAGDIGVHLAGIAGFILLGVQSYRSRQHSVSELILWPMWIVGAILVSTLNRGALLAVAIGVGVSLMLRPSSRIVTFVMAGVFLASSFVLIDPEVDLGARELSVDQVLTNVTSIFGGAREGDLEGTKSWRLRWWGEIIDYTVYGPYRWQGKGFGVNLADDDGFQVHADSSVRSPHNGHLTILARMGVPGALLWITLQIWFAIALLAATIRSRQLRDTFWMPINSWLLVYWLAMLVNTSFDVYLEGPQGGIWFWSVLGLGMAAVRLQAGATGTDRSAVQAPPESAAGGPQSSAFAVRTGNQ